MKQRVEVDKCLTIFDLKIGKAQCLPESIMARIMFFYDKKQNIKTFTILDRKIGMDVSRRITLWLEKNMDDHEPLFSLKANEIDADRHQKEMRC